jgi:hypothetical protein
MTSPVAPEVMAACFVGLAFSTPCVGASPLPDAAFVEKVEHLMLWIADRSDLEAADHQPAFLFLPTTTINYAVSGFLYGGADLVQAAFSWTGTGIVLLPDEGLTDDVLMHELVHFMQMTNGRGASCYGDLERQAYELQALFTEETGIGEPVDLLTRILATSCPAPWKSEQHDTELAVKLRLTGTTARRARGE